MPVEIRELIIVATIDEEGESGGKATAGAAKVGAPLPADREQLVALCVEQVMALLEERAER